MVPQVVELELWSLPGSPRTPFDGKTVAERCQLETSMSPRVVLGLNFIPGAEDVQSLGASLATGELRQEDFMEFCTERGLEPDPHKEQSAAEFLAFSQGQALAWLHLPAEADGLTMARTLVTWARQNEMQLRDGASTYEPLSEDQVYAYWPE